MSKLSLKIVAVLIITVGLLVPLAMIRGLIHERSGYRDQARADIASSWTASQTLIGPLLVVPCKTAGPVQERPPTLFIPPETLEISSSLRTEQRRRGIYSVPVYNTRLTITGEFDLSGSAGWESSGPGVLDRDAAVLTLSLSDNRGIAGEPALAWAGEARDWSAGSPLGSSSGLYAEVGPFGPEAPSRYPFRIELELRGMEALSFAPVGADTRVVMDAAWPHPSFVGRFLPVEYEVDDERFTAEWRVSGLASGRPQSWLGGAAKLVEELDAASFGVSLISPVDVYLQAMRSVKYGNLIVLLTFTAFFLVEVVGRLTLHPVQYLLMGLALVIFFLLLLALSEHMAFGLAYVVAVVACVGLIGVYTGAALNNRVQGGYVMATLGGLYAMLYAILRSEDNALLMGSLLLFFALATVMLVTRRIDWYRLAPRTPLPSGEPVVTE